MFRRVGLALVFGIIAFLVCTFFGGLLATVGISWVAAMGAFLQEWAVLISLVVFAWHFFAGGFSTKA